MILGRLVELLAPTVCVGCGREGDVLCSACLDLVDAGRASKCYRCDRTSEDGQTCATCLPYCSLAGVSVGSYYDGAVRELILQLKFHRLRAAAVGAAELLVRALPTLEPDLITSVPVAPVRYRERGYNQAELIGRQLARRLDVPYRTLLGRTTSSHQLGTNRQMRLEQVHGAFFPMSRLAGDPRVLLVDDVVTTGATMDECARVLKTGGAGKVWGAAAARH